jgi:hypothetical protein
MIALLGLPLYADIITIHYFDKFINGLLSIRKTRTSMNIYRTIIDKNLPYQHIYSFQANMYGHQDQLEDCALQLSLNYFSI